LQATKVPSHGNAHDYLGGDEPADAPGLEAAIITTGSFQRRPRGLADGASAARQKQWEEEVKKAAASGPPAGRR
jgi:hypothetical protein